MAIAAADCDAMIKAATRANLGTYDSDIRDAGTVATWGAIRWRAAAKPGEVEVFTRSGNTATPDETWSPWSKAYTSENGEKITSPNARYLQCSVAPWGELGAGEAHAPCLTCNATIRSAPGRTMMQPVRLHQAPE